jgi:hypothetical protein
MPYIPFLGSLFGSSAQASEKMSFPDQRTPQEWQAVLNKGMYDLEGSLLLPFSPRSPANFFVI